MRNKQWFIVQTALLLLILFSPFRIELHLSLSMRYLGLLFFAIGMCPAIYATLSLRENLKPSPKPRAGGYLVTSGLYRIVRHPTYAGILLAASGISLWMSDLLRAKLTLVLFILLDAKTRIEEKWLEKMYSEYVAYKKQVTKEFFPLVF